MQLNGAALEMGLIGALTPHPNPLPRVRGRGSRNYSLSRLRERAGVRAAPRYIVSENSSRPISMRRISLVPAPISYSLASRQSRPSGYSLM